MSMCCGFHANMPSLFAGYGLLDQIGMMMLSSCMVLGGVIAVILDNIIPGDLNTDKQTSSITYLYSSILDIEILFINGSHKNMLYHINHQGIIFLLYN